MKITITTLLAASTVLAHPATPTPKRTYTLQITDIWAQAAKAESSAGMHFVVTGPNYSDDTPTDCNLLWTYGSLPKQNARCNNGEYYIKLPNGAPDFNRFTLGLERVSGAITEDGQVLLRSNKKGDAPGTKWICVDTPEEGVKISCSYEGVLEMAV